MRYLLASALLTLLLSSAASASPMEKPSGEYAAFLESGGGLRMMRIARGAFMAALGEAAPPPRPSPETGRPAGPRDEPPPPEWPEGPVGLLLCASVGEKIRRCEGAAEPPYRELGIAVTSLGDRLGMGMAAGRRRLKAKDHARTRLEAAFILDAEEVPYGEWKRIGREDGIDLGARGLLVFSGGSRAVVAPGEARSWRRALRIARGRRSGERWRVPERVLVFRAVSGGVLDLLSP